MMSFENTGFSNKEKEVKPFYKQFEQRKKINIPGGNIEIVDVSPENLKTEVPTMFSPGWGNTPEALKASMAELVTSGRRVLTVDHPRYGGEVEENNEYTDEELRKALSILATIQESGVEKVDTIGYSEGGINTIIAASLAPEKFRNIVLVDPGGMVGKTSFMTLLKRFSKFMAKTGIETITKPETKKNINIATKELFKYFLKNPSRALKESSEIATYEIQEKLEELRKKGIGISVIHGVDDDVFPMEEVQNKTGKEHVDGFYSVKGGHAEIVQHPEKYMDLVDDALDKLEEKGKKDNQI